MEKFIKENWFKVGLLAISTIFVVSAFYWFEWRPTQIKKECNISSIKNAQDFYKTKYSYEKQEIEKGYYLVDNYESYYKQCLREKGL